MDKKRLMDIEASYRKDNPKAVRRSPVNSNNTFGGKINPNFVRARDINYGSNMCDFDTRKVRRLENLAVSIAKENEKLSLSEVPDKLENITKDL